ncbi:MAG: hypothetical protein HYW78_01820 [Parcubacteria group bacterium]|nr:hypothetical protein [Parcubacteria group bacterium]
MTENTEFSPREYVKKRKQYRLFGGIATIFAFVNLLDSGTPFPIPFVGWVSVYVSIFIFAFSIPVLVYGLLPPSAKIIAEIARMNNGYVLASFLVYYLDIKTKTAERVMYKLFSQGYLDIVNRVYNDTPISQWVCVFIGVTHEQTRPRNTPASQLDLSDYTSERREWTVEEINNLLHGGDLHIPTDDEKKP